MKFVYPELLALVALVPIAGLWWSFLRLRREKKLSIMSSSFRKDSTSRFQSFFMLAGLFLVLLAAARPQWGRTNQKFTARSRNVVVAIDVSRSMLARDVLPNRLERAKADVADLIDSLDADRCALVAFRRTGVPICPLTSDHAFLRSRLESLSPESAAAGETDLGAAIRASLDVLTSCGVDDRVKDDHSAIIIISDGGDLRGEALECAAIAKKRGIPIFTVGIGDRIRGATIPAADGRGDVKHQGKIVMVKLEEAAMKAIAAASGGRYVPLTTNSTAETTLGSIYRKFLRQVAAKEQNEEESVAAERFQLFLIPGLVLLMIGAALSKGRFKSTAKKN